MPTVLLIDAERELALLDPGFRAAGFATVLADSAERAIALLDAGPPDAVVLDPSPSGLPGFDLCRRLRADPRTRALPIVICAASADEADRVRAFELGADDYVTKPFSMRELVLRVRAALRRAAAPPSPERPPDRVGPLALDVDAHRCWVDGVEVTLTPTEFRLLVTLAARPGKVQTRERLLADVWSAEPELETRTLDTHVKRLREKLGHARALIETVRGVGYRLAPEDRAPRATKPHA